VADAKAEAEADATCAATCESVAARLVAEIAASYDESAAPKPPLDPRLFEPPAKELYPPATLVACLRSKNIDVWSFDSARFASLTGLRKQSSGGLIAATRGGIDGTAPKEHLMSACLLFGADGCMYVVVLDTVTYDRLDCTYGLLLGAMNVCGQGCQVYISVPRAYFGVKDLLRALGVPLETCCMCETAYRTLKELLNIDESKIYPVQREDCILRFCLKYDAFDTSQASLWTRRRVMGGAEPVWYSSELGTIAIACIPNTEYPYPAFGSARAGAGAGAAASAAINVDVIAVVFRVWYEEAFHFLQAFLSSDYTRCDTLMLYLQKDGDTGPDLVPRRDVLARLRQRRITGTTCDSGIETDEKLRRLLTTTPSMAFEGSETFVHRLTSAYDAGLPPDQARFVCYDSAYTKVLASALIGCGDVDDTGTIKYIRASNGDCPELWHAIYCFENPVAVQDTRGVVFDADAVARHRKAVADEVLCLSPTGLAFQRTLIVRWNRVSKEIPFHERPIEYAVRSWKDPCVPRINGEQGILLYADKNCWKAAAGYVGMTPARFGLENSLMHPNIGLRYRPHDRKDEFVNLTYLRDVVLFKKYTSHCHFFIVGDPNYTYLSPDEDYFDLRPSSEWLKWLKAIAVATETVVSMKLVRNMKLLA
jgi:hypothetical protein